MLSWYGQIGLILYKDAFKKLMLVFSRGGMSLRFVCRDVDFFFSKLSETTALVFEQYDDAQNFEKNFCVKDFYSVHQERENGNSSLKGD